MGRTDHLLARRLLGFAVGFATALGIIVVTEASGNIPRRGEVLGSLDVAAYCRQTEEPLEPALREQDAYGWRCVGRRNGIWGFEEVDYDAACRSQYGRRARATTTDPESPDSWTCVMR